MLASYQAGVRFNELGRAIMEHQKEHFRTNIGVKYQFLSYCCKDDVLCSDLKSDIAGKLMTAQRSVLS